MAISLSTLTPAERRAAKVAAILSTSASWVQRTGRDEREGGHGEASEMHGDLACHRTRSRGRRNTTGGATVPTCSEFCDLSIASCGASGANAQFANKGQCTRACDALPPGTGNETSGNSVSCRTYHAGVAGQPGNAAVHCPHSGFSGGGTCGDRCQAFCQIVTDLCVPPLAKPFASLADYRTMTPFVLAIVALLWFAGRRSQLAGRM